MKMHLDTLIVCWVDLFHMNYAVIERYGTILPDALHGWDGKRTFIASRRRHAFTFQKRKMPRKVYLGLLDWRADKLPNFYLLMIAVLSWSKLSESK